MRRFMRRQDPVIQAEVDKSYLGQLLIICPVVFLYYTFITAAHFFFLEEDILVPVAGTSSAASLMALALWILVKTGNVRPEHSHLAFVPVALMVFTTVFVHIELSQEQIQLTNAVMVLYAYGFVALSRFVYTGLMLIAGGLYVLCLLSLSGEYTAHLGFMFVAVVALSIMGFLSRYRSLVKMSRLLALSQEKTRQLSNATREIRQRMEEVQTANSARDVFLANVTHELRTPLTGVIGMLDLLEENASSKDQKFMVGTARRSAGYLLNIINDLLDLSKLDAGKVTLDEQAADLVQITADATETFQAEAAAKGIALKFEDPQQTSLPVLADDVRVSQILLNLISNAVKFTEHGGVTVSLAYESGAAVWRVSDTGPGIDLKVAERLFNRFEQLDSSSTRNKAGTGLGLSIVHELAQLMRGSVTVESELGAGACFIVTLKLKEISNEQLQTELPDENQHAGMIDLSSLGLNVLVVEDNQVNQMLIAKILTGMGVASTVLQNGQLAVDEIDEGKTAYDLILMDVQMPVMDGVTATKAIQKLPKDTPPIIALTANTFAADQVEYLAAGMKAIIGKPIDVGQCQQTILEVLQRD